MRRPLTPVALLVMVTGAAWAADPPTKGEVVKATKPAVALIEKPLGDKTTNAVAFAVAPGGYFATALHALSVQYPGAKVKMVVRPGQEGEMEVEAAVVRVDAALDLALLKTDAANPPAPLPLAPADPAEKDELILFTFPQPRGVGQAEAPAIAVTTAVAGKPPADDRTRTKVESKVLAEGLPGAPAVNTAGKLAGVMGCRPLAEGMALIPVERVRRFVERPDITLTAPAVATKGRSDPAAYAVSLAFDPPVKDGVSVDLLVRTTAGEKSFPMKAADKGYEVSAAAFDKADPPKVQAELHFADGMARVAVADRAVKTSAGDRRLSELYRVTFGREGAAELADGSRAAGKVTGFGELTATLGGKPITLDPAAARELRVIHPPGSADCYLLTAVVKRDGREVGRKEVVKYLADTDPPPLAALKKGNFAKPREALVRRTYCTLVPTAGEPAGIAKPVERDGPAFQFVVLPLEPGGEMVRVEFAERFVQATTGGPGVWYFNPTRGMLVEFRAPKGKRMAAGEYRQADPDPRKSDSGMVGVVGEARKSPAAGLPFGHFVVHECELRDGKVETFAADFIWQPDGKVSSTLVGVVRFNSRYE